MAAALVTAASRALRVVSGGGVRRGGEGAGLGVVLCRFNSDSLTHNSPATDTTRVSDPVVSDLLVSDLVVSDPYTDPPRRCVLCNIDVDYKNTQLLSQFISSHTGKIYGRHITGLCSMKQKQITKAIKRAQKMGFMAVTLKEPLFRSDPQVCNVRLPQ
uniref:Small ribosomal subunit protein bS18m n=1 Tax=Petromyzon marinus TaxID=7757 RepID=A0AAJ7WKI9_PETMA|nr:28S ribosomal protein S18c, mitochondrial isoform X1 [Petromyzon marinus]